MTRSAFDGYWAAGSWLLLAVACGCNSSFQDCEATRSCTHPAAAGDSGAGGDGDSGGAGNAPARGGASGSAGKGGGVALEAPCSADGDCDDGLYCTGYERCLDSTCRAGESPCQNDDPDHCAIACDEGADGPLCSLEGRDADGDGHGDPTCSENPGDDCDDTKDGGADVHPGADELCNAGVDDDCDGADESTDEIALPGSSATLVAAMASSVRNHPAVAAVPSGGFGVVWADGRDGQTEHVYYRALAADGTAGPELKLTSGTTYYANDYPDLAVWSDEFVVAYRTQASSDDHSEIQAVEVKFDGSLSENPSTANANVMLDSRPQLSESNVYFKTGSDDLILCAKDAGCIPLGPNTPYTANTFHVSPLSQRLAYEWAGNIYYENPPAEINPALLEESPTETRTNPVITEDGSDVLIAYRYDDEGMRVGDCELPDGIPIDIAPTGDSASVLLYWNPGQTALYVRVVSTDCALTPSALVVEEDGTAIDSASLAIDPSGVVAVVWSSRDKASDEWTIMRRLFAATLCE